MPFRRATFSYLTILLIFISSKSFGQSDSIAAGYNYVIGSQTFGAAYKFTSDNALLETAKAIRTMGSDIIKFHLTSGIDGTTTSPRFSNLDTLIDQEATMRYIFDSLDFKHYFMWVRSYNHWYDGYSPTERQDDSIKLYNLTKYLLQKYQNSGKKFFIGHWEGDWYLLPGYDINANPSYAVLENMRQWLQTRQNAIDQAKLDFQSSGVEVYHYAEVNRVLDAYTGGKRRMVNEVIPYVNIDYISYSAYDTQHFSKVGFHNVLNYIESFLPPKNLPPGKRVFIGEFGRPADAFNYNDSLHELNNREILRKGLSWCSPYMLYWEMYNNEIRNGRQRGFWLIDSANVKTKLYRSFENFYKNASNWVYNYHQKNGFAPNACTYGAWADSILANPLSKLVINRISLKEENSHPRTIIAYPNPSANGSFTIQIKGEGDLHYQVYHSSGKLILEGKAKFPRTEIKLNSPGLYYFHLQDSRKTRSLKLLVP